MDLAPAVTEIFGQGWSHRHLCACGAGPADAAREEAASANAAEAESGQEAVYRAYTSYGR